MVSTNFDPAAHLSRQGWKGKGTALKIGHATRPLPVVQKKTLSGIGKDRDEAIPFWDQIFASTAATLFPSTPNPSLTSYTATAPTTSSSRASASSVLLPLASLPAQRSDLSTSARLGREVAHRGLYSKFLLGSKPSISTERVPETEDIAVQSNVRTSQVSNEAVKGNTAADNEGEAEAGKFERKRKKGVVVWQSAIEEGEALRNTPNDDSARRCSVAVEGIGLMRPKVKKRRREKRKKNQSRGDDAISSPDRPKKQGVVKLNRWSGKRDAVSGK
ncbi:MAG: hypothetical protein TREMPRED_002410 [Tremellales sp. Tagirdzhanova-0007]|nr:MAG: hypothetical protein TREMPRED_002410 [Tremellales sp. Tagirdzhanova-0007]